MLTDKELRDKVSFSSFQAIQDFREIKETKDLAKRQELLGLIQKFKKLLSDTEEVKELTQRYLMEGIFTVTQIDDAIHVAIATTNYLNILVSWNRQHLVRIKSKIKVNSVNLSMGYYPLEIVTPEEL